MRLEAQFAIAHLPGLFHRFEHGPAATVFLLFFNQHSVGFIPGVLWQAGLPDGLGAWADENVRAEPFQRFAPATIQQGVIFPVWGRFKQ